MKSQATRRFGIGDALILMAATAVGLAGVRYHADRMEFEWSDLRMEHVDYMPLRAWVLLSVVARFSMPLLLSWSFAVALLRLRAPRPERERLWCQPGFLACVAACTPFGWRFATLTCSWLTVRLMAADPGMPRGTVIIHGSFELSDIAVLTAEAQEYVGQAVLLVWLTCWAGRRWSAEPSWTDRIGRVLGGLWIVFSLIYALEPPF